MPALRVCVLALLGTCVFAVGLFQPALAASADSAAAIIADLTSWIRKNRQPDEAAWAHAAHFSIPYEIDPGHNIPAPVATRVDAGYARDALWLRFEAQDPHPGDIGLRYREHEDISSYFDDYVGVFLSPFDDAQWSYEIVCTAGGAEWDAFRQQNNEYSSWDAVWSCSATRTASGYQGRARSATNSSAVPSTTTATARCAGCRPCAPRRPSRRARPTSS